MTFHKNYVFAILIWTSMTQICLGLFCANDYMQCTRVRSTYSLRSSSIDVIDCKYVLRVCDGPSCSNMGSEQILDQLYLKSNSVADDGNQLFEVGRVDCLNACKRGCNVALVMKGTPYHTVSNFIEE
jgi:NADH:ubiquinone oxidoreductase subunit E